MKSSFDQFCINVRNLDKSIYFYETVRGFRISHRIEQPGGMNITEVWRRESSRSQRRGALKPGP